MTGKEIDKKVFELSMAHIMLGIKYAAQLCDQLDCDECPFSNEECITLRDVCSNTSTDQLGLMWHGYTNDTLDDIEAVVESIEEAAEGAYDDMFRS